jgi:hypothetical protein
MKFYLTVGLRRLRAQTIPPSLAKFFNRVVFNFCALQSIGTESTITIDRVAVEIQVIDARENSLSKRCPI